MFLQAAQIFQAGGSIFRELEHGKNPCVGIQKSPFSPIAILQLIRNQLTPLPQQTFAWHALQMGAVTLKEEPLLVPASVEQAIHLELARSFLLGEKLAHAGG